MTTRENVSLASLTTFNIGGAARAVYECANSADLREALERIRASGMPWYVLGGGSNILAADEGYPGAIIRITDETISFTPRGETEEVVAGAGARWDALVEAAAARHAWGIENLAGIPGTAGAAPVQNIGAYGAELADTLAWVDAFDTNTDAVIRLTREECAFGYRTSRFKRDRTLIILRIALALSTAPNPRLSYADLARAQASGAALTNPGEIANAVRAIRAKKFPDLTKVGTAGSFFKNPVLSSAAYAALAQKYPGIPGFPFEGKVKVSLAWILDHALSLKGFGEGNARLFEAQPLVIVAEPGARACDVERLAHVVAQKVFEKTNIELEWEVRSLK